MNSKAVFSTHVGFPAVLPSIPCSSSAPCLTVYKHGEPLLYFLIFFPFLKDVFLNFLFFLFLFFPPPLFPAFMTRSSTHFICGMFFVFFNSDCFVIDSFSFFITLAIFWDIFLHLIVVVASLSLGFFRWYHMLICRFISVHVYMPSVYFGLVGATRWPLLYSPAPLVFLYSPPPQIPFYFLPSSFIPSSSFPYPSLPPTLFAAPHLLLSLPPPVTRQHWDEGGGDPEEPERLAAGA